MNIILKRIYIYKENFEKKNTFLEQNFRNIKEKSKEINKYLWENLKIIITIALNKKTFYNTQVKKCLQIFIVIFDV